MRSQPAMPPHNVLQGRVAVVTGSSRGLGFAMARVLGLHGAALVLASRSDDDVAAAVGRLRLEGIAADGRRCDTGEPADVEALRDMALGRGTLDIWVNNAGTSGVYGPTASTPVDASHGWYGPTSWARSTAPGPPCRCSWSKAMATW